MLINTLRKTHIISLKILGIDRISMYKNEIIVLNNDAKYDHDNTNKHSFHNRWTEIYSPLFVAIHGTIHSFWLFMHIMYFSSGRIKISFTFLNSMALAMKKVQAYYEQDMKKSKVFSIVNKLFNITKRRLVEDGTSWPKKCPFVGNFLDSFQSIQFCK